jgi:hypothetical protein
MADVFVVKAAGFVGLTVTSIICLVAPLTQVGLNPARDLGPRIVAWVMGWGDATFPDRVGGFFHVYVLAESGWRRSCGVIAAGSAMGSSIAGSLRMCPQRPSPGDRLAVWLGYDVCLSINYPSRVRSGGRVREEPAVNQRGAEAVSTGGHRPKPIEYAVMIECIHSPTGIVRLTGHRPDRQLVWLRLAPQRCGHPLCRSSIRQTERTLRCRRQERGTGCPDRLPMLEVLTR